MGRIQGRTRGGIIRAAAALDDHRAAALYDFITQFHAAPEFYPVHERLLLAVGLLRDHFSHLSAAVNGWLYVPPVAEWVMYRERDLAVLDSIDPKKRSRWKPLERPWEPPPVIPKLTNESRAMLNAHAQKMTGG